MKCEKQSEDRWKKKNSAQKSNPKNAKEENKKKKKYAVKEEKVKVNLNAYSIYRSVRYLTAV